VDHCTSAEFLVAKTDTIYHSFCNLARSSTLSQLSSASKTSHSFCAPRSNLEKRVSRISTSTSRATARILRWFALQYGNPVNPLGLCVATGPNGGKEQREKLVRMKIIISSEFKLTLLFLVRGFFEDPGYISLMISQKCVLVVTCCHRLLQPLRELIMRLLHFSAF
jgi:hypothetical protein